MGNGRRHGGGANALSAAAVPERAALMLPVFAGCHSLDLRSLQRPALTQRSPWARFTTRLGQSHLRAREACPPASIKPLRAELGNFERPPVS